MYVKCVDHVLFITDMFRSPLWSLSG